MSLSATSAMKLPKALMIAEEVEKATRLWGKQAKVAYRPEDILVAFAMIYRERQITAEKEVPKELLTKANRQLAACKAQKSRLVKKYGADDIADESDVT